MMMSTTITVKTVFMSMLLTALLLISCRSTRLLEVGEGWAGNTVNTAVFRKNSVVSDKHYQYTSYYDAEGYLTVAKRPLSSKRWQVQRTGYQGNVRDAHNVISMMVDGDGYIHIAWDHHNGRLRYIKSIEPNRLVFSEELPMTGMHENRVTYPEFYRMPNGDLLFLYRDGGSGAGNLVINRYDLTSRKWRRMHDHLIHGEGQRNAYWQAYVDNHGTIHISWVWRSSPDVASNHDMAYARSKDGGITWEKTTGEKYALPITASNAEYAARIPVKSELINQTSMAADEAGNPFIASYWRDAGSDVPQYKLIYHVDGRWTTRSLDFRTTPFSLSGGGTKEIPIARPQLMVKGEGQDATVLLLFRDIERERKPSALLLPSLYSDAFRIFDLADLTVGSWEPSFDTELWRRKNILGLFLQHTEQKDGEGVLDAPATKVHILIHKPGF